MTKIGITHSMAPLRLAWEQSPQTVDGWIRHYARCLDLELNDLLVTTDRREFERWLGRRVKPSIGGAYVYLSRLRRHAILVQLERLDPDHPRAVELVVAEELIHMRDWLDGDRRRHAKHGYDRIALRVSQLTGATLEEIRTVLLPAPSRPFRYVYQCPTCRREILRRRRGSWSCGRCSNRYHPMHRLILVRELQNDGVASDEA
jgi:predicted SprT family Zn-dependent metalloprotease